MDPAQTTGASPPPELLELAELRSQLARYRAAFELSVPGQALIGLTGRFLEGVPSRNPRFFRQAGKASIGAGRR